MKGKKAKGCKAILSMLLSAVLVMEPLGTAAIAHAKEDDGMMVQTETEAEENTVQLDEPSAAETDVDQSAEEDIENNEEESGEPKDEQTAEESPEEGVNDSSEDGGNEEEKSEEQPDEILVNPDDETNQNVEDEQQPNEGDDIFGDETDQDIEEEESVSGNDLAEEKEEKDEILEGFKEMPEDYHMNSVQMASKRELADRLDEIMELDEGSDYAEGELVLLVDSEEEAERVAEAYNAEIEKFQYGVLTLKLSKGDSVAKAMRVAANENINLPAAWPNYYVYAYGEEPAEDGSSDNSTVESDDLIEIETTEYELEMLGLTDSSMSESGELSYKAAYTDAYLYSNCSQYQYHHTVIGSPYAWEAGYTGTGVKVAVLDTGVGSNTDLPNVTGVGTNATQDLSGHGTHVAGIIAALANGQYGVGVAPGAQLYASNVLPDQGTGTVDDAIAGVRAVSGQAGSSIVVDVINMSLGSHGYTNLFQTVITEAYNKGVAIFAAAGNDGGGNYNYPACYDHVISIAATDQGNARASFSNYCDKVDLSAPGVDIYSTNAFEGQGDNSTYIDMSGTSMACPVAAGEAAVILSANPAELQGKTGGAKVDALLELMQSNTTKVSGSGMGKGITNLAKALNINTAYEKPAAPHIEIKPDGALQKVTITMSAQFGADIYYTDNGKNPVYKNGAPDANTKLYTQSFDIEDRAKCDVRAIAVNKSGICSAVVKKAYTMKPYVTDIEIMGVDQVAKGKSIQLAAAVMPTYAANKAVTWEIYTATAAGQPDQKIDKDSDKTLKTGVSITNKGKVAAAKTAKTGDYIVKVTAKDEKKDSSGTVIHVPFSTTYRVTVTETAKINSVKFAKNKLTLVLPTVTSCDLKTEAAFEAKQKASDGSLVEAEASDFRWSSNKTDVATVDANGVVTPHKAGKAVITALANDSSNKKATCTITVQQLTENVTITGSNVVGKSKSNTYKAVVQPADATNKKVTWSLSEKDTSGQWKEVDSKRAKAIGVSINAGNGKLSTTKNAVAGEYLIKAVSKDAAGTTAQKVVTVKEGLITKIAFSSPTATIYRTSNVFKVPTTTTVNVTVTGASGADLTAYEVTSSDVGGSIATVSNSTKNADGTTELTITATGRATGKVTVTVKAVDGSNKSAKCTINVNNSITGIRIAPSGSNNYCVAKGKSLQLKAVLETENGTLSNKKVDWELLGITGQPVAKTTGMNISASGKVTAAKTATEGFYIVRAIAKDRSAVGVYLISVAAPTTRLSIGGLSSRLINVGREGRAYYLPIDADTRQGGFSFSSSNPAVVSIGTSPTDRTGMTMEMVAYKKGSATITIKALDGSGKSVKYKIKVEN